MRFLRNVLAIGVPYGLVFALLAGAANPSWLVIGVTVLGATVVQGLIGAVMAAPLRRRVRWFVYPLAGLVLAVSGLILGGAAAYFVMAAPYVPAGRWHRLPDPPVKATAILGLRELTTNGDYLYIEADNGSMYRYKDGPTPGNWHMVADVPPAEPSEWERTGEEPPTPYPTPRPPGRVVDSQMVQFWWTDFGGQADYILLEDGSLWMTQRTWSAYTYLAQSAILVGYGALLGLVQGSLLPLIATKRSDAHNLNPQSIP